MVDHTRTPDDKEQEAKFYPVDGIRGHCVCGEYFHYIDREGSFECGECGRTWNVFVDFEEW